MVTALSYPWIVSSVRGRNSILLTIVLNIYLLNELTKEERREAEGVGRISSIICIITQLIIFLTFVGILKFPLPQNNNGVFPE